MLLTALLMGSISASAQDSGTPLKGDVNGDGVVNAADIVEIVNIMMGKDGGTSETKYYWYVGTTKPTSLSEATIVESYPAETIYTNNSGAKSHIFVLTNSDKTAIFEDPNTHGRVTQKEVDTTTIPGYNIFETSIGWANTGNIIIKIS